MHGFNSRCTNIKANDWTLCLYKGKLSPQKLLGIYTHSNLVLNAIAKGCFSPSFSFSVPIQTVFDKLLCYLKCEQA